jgi:hypothetical protein
LKNSKVKVFLFSYLIGENSFFYPFFTVVGDPETIFRWSDEEIEECNDPYIYKNAKEFKDDMVNVWQDFSAFFALNPIYYPPEKYFQLTCA